MTETEQTLKKLSSFLELKTNLKKEYSVKQTTGKYGDTSKNIKEGTIINTKKKLVKIDMETKVQLDNLYRETCVLLRKRNND